MRDPWGEERDADCRMSTKSLEETDPFYRPSAGLRAKLVIVHRQVKFSESYFQCKEAGKSEAGNQHTGFVFIECSFGLYRGDQSG